MVSKSKKELWFKKYPKGRKGGRWCKKIDGKTHYFGVGKSKSDTASYNAALAEYRRFMEVEYVRQLSRAHYRGKLEAHLGHPIEDGETMTVDDIVNGALDGWDSLDMTPSREKQADDLYVRQFREKLSGKKSDRETEAKSETTIGNYIDRWLKDEEQRQAADEITISGLKAMRQGIKTFRHFVDNKSFGDEGEVVPLLAGYRSHLVDFMIGGQYKPTTINDKLKFLRQFIMWAHQNYVLKEVPRNLGKVVKRFPVDKSGEPLTLKDVRKLWRHADPKMRCWIALGLNCGFKNSDIAGLKAEHLEKGRLIGRRGKTNVPMNYKLWPVTQQLIEQTRMDRDHEADDLLFVNAEGRPVVTDTGSDRVGHAFRKLAKHAGVKATFQQLRDTGVQAVQNLSRQAGQVNPALVQLYLAHKDGSTAAYYVSDDPHAMVTKPLDDILDRLDEYFKLDADQKVVERKAG